MPIDFPTTPAIGDLYSYQGRSWIYNGSAWDSVTPNYTLPAPLGNAIINGAFDIWQRGTSFTNTSVQEYTADRWREYTGAVTVERSTDVPNNNFTYSLEASITTTGFNIVGQRIESDNAKTLSDTVTLSFWGKSISGTSVIRYNARRATAKDDFTTTTSIIAEDLELSPSTDWKRYSSTFTIPPEAKQNGFEIRIIRDGASVYRITGVQLESGTVATPFKLNTPNIQAELAACQRYYWRQNSLVRYTKAYDAFINSATSIRGMYRLPVVMRAVPSFSASGTFSSPLTGSVTSLNGNFFRDYGGQLTGIISGGTIGQATAVEFDSATSYLEFNAEL
jgi:hypothetical protein